ncbi:MAG: hypothetical protein KAR39_12350 [Thermoplasmata archaeon]|nr:hypothetical protein [Thermoplasmata archaeon]
MSEIRNPSFENGWIDVLSSAVTTNQQPAEWSLLWLEPGNYLWDSHDHAMVVPECVHKLSIQLPSSEQLGGPDALILDGDTVYKMFSNGAFGAELRQVVTGLKPGSSAGVFVPVQIHRHDDNDPYAAEVGVWVNGIGQWTQPNDKHWSQLRCFGKVDPNGALEVVIRVKSKWANRKDFFIDDITFDFVPANAEPPPPPELEPEAIMTVTLFDDGSGKWELL